jgi:hypothetical protein
MHTYSTYFVYAIHMSNMRTNVCTNAHHTHAQTQHRSKCIMYIIHSHEAFTHRHIYDTCKCAKNIRHIQIFMHIYHIHLPHTYIMYVNNTCTSYTCSKNVYCMRHRVCTPYTLTYHVCMPHTSTKSIHIYAARTRCSVCFHFHVWVR